MSHFLELSQLHKTFPTPKGPLTVVKDFNLKFRKGEFIALALAVSTLGSTRFKHLVFHPS